MRRILRILPALIIALLLPFNGASLAAPALNKEKEREIAKRIERDVAREFDAMDDAYVAGYVNAIVDRIKKASPELEFSISVHIIQSPAVNAFAVPGGVVFLTTGIIHQMENEDELAGVLAHEISHVAGRHIAYRLEKGQMISMASTAAIFGAILLGGKIDPKLAQAALAFGVAGAEAKMLSYSRADEEDADRRGAETLEAAGYGSGGLLSFMEKLGRLSPVPEEIPAYLLTHPSPGKRAEMLQASLKPGRQPPNPAQGYYWLFQARVAAADPKPWSLKLIENRAFSQPLSFNAQLGLAIAARSQGDFATALQQLDLCDVLSPEHPEALHERALVELFTGQGDQGIQRLKALREAGKAPTGALRDLGWAYLEKNKGAEALEVFDSLQKTDPGWTDLPLHRGMALGKAGREAEAHLELGRYYLGLDSKLARNHLQKAYAALPDGVKKEDAKTLLDHLEEEARQEQKKAGPQ